MIGKETSHGPDKSRGVNIAASFNEEEVRDYDRERLHRYMTSMLDGQQILHNGAMVMYPSSDKVVIQVKLNKSTVSKEIIDEIDDIFKALGGHIETWVLCDSVLEHPEIYN